MAVLAHRLKRSPHLTEAEAGFVRVADKMAERAAQQPNGTATAQASRVRGLGRRLHNGHPGKFAAQIWRVERRPDGGQVAGIYALAGKTP